MPQNQIWHKEGDVYTHTCYVIQEVLNNIDNVEIEDFKEILILAAMLHDVGKCYTTIQDDKGVYHSPNHAQKSCEIADKFLQEHEYPSRIIDPVLSIIRNHMKISHVLSSKDEVKSILKIVNDLYMVPFEYFILFKQCDQLGSVFDREDSLDLDTILDIYYDNIGFLPKQKVSIVKQEDLVFNGQHPFVSVGDQYDGKLLIPITKGFSVFVGRMFNTSSVEEIIDKNTFRTKNSIYKITAI